MAYIKLALRSNALQSRIGINLYYPTDLPLEVGNEVKGVLTLLHGYSNSSDDWVQMSAASRYAADNGLILVMPDCGNSFYTDMVYGGAYYTFMTQELPEQLSAIFNLPTDREHNYIAGLSMGGYGALLLGLSCPQKYSAIASFSGAVDVKYMIEKGGKDFADSAFTSIFGSNLTVPDTSDLFILARKASVLPDALKPRIMCICGSKDDEPFFIKEQNHRFNEVMRTLPLEYKYLEWDGIHEWCVWDRALTEAIGFFLHTDYAKLKAYNWECKPTVII
ncbi:MAG: alpha/beta hydrolase-fold protein [Oscillospiraceae bacterium]